MPFSEPPILLNIVLPVICIRDLFPTKKYFVFIGLVVITVTINKLHLQLSLLFIEHSIHQNINDLVRCVYIFVMQSFTQPRDHYVLMPGHLVL